MKQLARMRHSAKRNALSKEAVHGKSARIAELFMQLPEAQRAKTILVYVGVRNEVQTTALIEKLLSLGKRVVVPVTDFKKKELLLSELRGLQELEEKEFGLMEPKKEAFRTVKPEELDLIVVPGVAFDRSGGRIGMGFGYYDKLLRRIPRKTLLVGFCFSENLDEKLPCESHDARMQVVITDAGVIECR
ncbi:MAG: 5-formyltetrahydrofolate cyclo-ligase [Candidatus Diapherotrites archaeon]|nr:5-formyltetrahydrofolate cyclo-ligase [Candidatus Diapherotrites archaeon]